MRDPSVAERGGGVLIAVSKTLASRLIVLDNIDSDFEHLYVSVGKNNTKFIISCTYIPPNSDVSCYVEVISQIEHLKQTFPDHSFLITGDFNIPNIKWSYVNNISQIDFLPKITKETKGISRYFHSYILKLKLLQKNVHTNIANNTLDLVLSTLLDFIVEIPDEFISKTDVYHPPLEIIIDLKKIITFSHCSSDFSPLHLVTYDYKNANYDLINEKINDINWNEELDNLNTLDAIDKFYYIVNSLIDENVKKKTIEFDNFPNWFSNKLKSLIIDKKKAHVIYKKTGSALDYQEFSRLRRLTKVEINISYNNYIKNVENSILDNPRYFWKFISTKNNNCRLPKNMFLENTESKNNTESADLFKKFFMSVYETHNNVNISHNEEGNFEKVEFKLDDIIQAIKEIKNSNTIGPDGMPVSFLKNTIYQISLPLHIIFNKSLNSGENHFLWKLNHITPIFKNGDRNNVANYRPITIISSVAKILDNMIAKYMQKFFEKIISPMQHGFVKGSSTLTNLSIFTNYLYESFADQTQVDCIYIDFKKAFDLVDHSLLITKLYRYGVPKCIIIWIQNYLDNRKGKVKVNGVFSMIFGISSGVPQGTHIGPILFIIFVNDIIDIFKSSLALLFADDLKLYLKIKDLMDCLLLQDDLDNLFQWCTDNFMSVNILKTKIMSYTRKVTRIDYNYSMNDAVLCRTDIIKDLGINFDSKLDFEFHCNKILTSANRTWYNILRNCSDFKDPNVIKTLYLSLVRSKITYGSIIWRPIFKNSLQKFEKLQHKALRKIAFLKGTPLPRFCHDYSVIASSLNIPSISSFFHYADLSFTYKTFKENKCTSFIDLFGKNVNQYSLRSQRPFTAPTPLRKYMYKNPSIRLSHQFNDFCNNKPYIANFDIEINAAKKYFKKHILLYE